MTDIFNQSRKPAPRTFGDKVFDNFGWIMLAMFLVSVIGVGTFVYMLSTHLTEIAHAAGGVARAAADGYSNPPRK
jgi:hypothetical protein